MEKAIRRLHRTRNWQVAIALRHEFYRLARRLFQRELAVRRAIVAILHCIFGGARATIHIGARARGGGSKREGVKAPVRSPLSLSLALARALMEARIHMRILLIRRSGVFLFLSLSTRSARALYCFSTSVNFGNLFFCLTFYAHAYAWVVYAFLNVILAGGGGGALCSCRSVGAAEKYKQKII